MPWNAKTLQGFVHAVENGTQMLDGISFDANLVGQLAAWIALDNGWSLELNTKEAYTKLH